MSEHGIGRGDVTMRWVALAGALFLAVPIGVFIIELATGIDLEPVMRDTSAAADVPYYYGYVSTIGIFVWGAGVGASAVAFLALRSVGSRRVVRFLGTTLLLTLLLGLDDGLLWHEVVLPARGVPEPVAEAGYVLAGLAWLAVNRRYILESRYVILGIAIACFALSVGLDFYERVLPRLSEQVLIEDGLKFVGIGMWTTYVVVECLAQLREAWRHDEAREAAE